MALNNIQKEIVTIWLYIDKAYQKGDHHSHSYIKVLKKITQKLIDHLKDSKYDFEPHNTGNKMSAHLQFQLDEKDDRFLPTYIQMYLHQLIHEHCGEYDPNVKEEYRKKITFYKETLERLI